MRHAHLAILALAALGVWPRPASAQAAIQVTANDASYTFAERLSFTLGARADFPIDDVVLHYQVGDDGVLNRRIPEFTPGTTVAARHVEDLARGQIPPASAITWWWTVASPDGGAIETPRRSFRYVDTRFGWRTTDGTDVNVWWYGASDGFARSLAQDARAALADLAATIGTLPTGTVQIVTYQSREDMRAALPDRGTVFESRLTTLGSRVAPDILLLLAGSDNPEVADVLRHELAHLVLHRRMGRDYLTIPAWLDEGLAMYAEGELDGAEARRLRQAIRDDGLMSLRSLTTFPGQADLVPLAYAESRDIVAWLIAEHGAARFQRLLDALAGGRQDIDQALRATYGLDQAGLYQSYRAARGLPPAGTPPPRTVAAQRHDGAAVPCGAGLLVVTAVLWGGRRTFRHPLLRRTRHPAVTQGRPTTSLHVDGDKRRWDHGAP